MCRRFIPIDRDEVARIAAEIERDLSEHVGELGSLDPLEAYEEFLATEVDVARPAAPQRSASQLSLFD